jgi:hypothetical protein
MIGIPMGTNCAPLLTYLFLHAYEADFLQCLLKNKDRKLSQTFNSSFRYIDDVLWLNNSQFIDYLYRIYPNELQVKDTTDNQKFASYLDLHLEIANEGRSKTKLWQMWWLHFSNNQFFFQSIAIFQHHQHKEFTFHNSYIILELVPSSDFLDRAQLLMQKLFKQGYVTPTSHCNKNSTKKSYEISISQMTMDLLLFMYCRYFLSSITAKTFIKFYRTWLLYE